MIILMHYYCVRSLLLSRRPSSWSILAGLFFETKQSASGFVQTVQQFYEHLESQESVEFTKMSSLVLDDEEYKFAFRRVFKVIWTRSC